MSFPPRPVPTVSVKEAAKRLEADGPARPLVVDVRDTHEFARVRAEGAVLLPLGTFVHRFRELPADRPLLLICASGQRSASAAAFLLANGYPDVANVAGGTFAWLAAGLPVRTGLPAPGEGELPGAGS